MVKPEGAARRAADDVRIVARPAASALKKRPAEGNLPAVVAADGDASDGGAPASTRAPSDRDIRAASKQLLGGFFGMGRTTVRRDRLSAVEVLSCAGAEAIKLISKVFSKERDPIIRSAILEGLRSMERSRPAIALLDHAAVFDRNQNVRGVAIEVRAVVSPDDTLEWIGSHELLTRPQGKHSNGHGKKAAHKGEHPSVRIASLHALEHLVSVSFGTLARESLATIVKKHTETSEVEPVQRAALETLQRIIASPDGAALGAKLYSGGKELNGTGAKQARAALGRELLRSEAGQTALVAFVRDEKRESANRLQALGALMQVTKVGAESIHADVRELLSEVAADPEAVLGALGEGGEATKARARQVLGTLG